LKIKYINSNENINEEALKDSLNSYFKHIEFKYKLEEMDIEIKIEVCDPLNVTVHGAVLHRNMLYFTFTGSANQPIVHINQKNA